MSFQASDSTGAYYARFLYGYQPTSQLVDSQSEGWTTVASIDAPVSGALLAPSKPIKGTLYRQNQIPKQLTAIGMTYKSFADGFAPNNAWL